MVTLYAFIAVTLAISCERIVELVVAKRNAAWSFSQGGEEYGQEHYPFMVVAHTLLLIAGPLEVWYMSRPFSYWEAGICSALLLATQGLRWWCITTLGKQWNTKVIIVPNLNRVLAGPYRWIRHPNYVAVVIEGFALPLWHHAYLTAIVFSLANFAILTVRIRCENNALSLMKGKLA